MPPKRKKTNSTNKNNQQNTHAPSKINIGNKLISARLLKGSSGLETAQMRISFINGLVKKKQLTKQEGVICFNRLREGDRQHLIGKLTLDITNRLGRTNINELRNAFRTDIQKRIKRYKFLGKQNCSKALHAALETCASETSLQKNTILYDEAQNIIARVFPTKGKKK